MKIFKKPIFVSVSPNAQRDDVWLALKFIFQPWKWKQGKCSEKLEKMLGDYLDDSVWGQDPDGVRAQTPDFNVVLFESGRTALYAILMALGIKKEDEVLIQAFTCTAAVNPILWVGARPVYVDIENNGYNISPEDLEVKITPQSKVVIIQHTFGFPAQINKILEIAKRHNLIVVEDCAHSLGAKYNGEKLGTFGEASFFSFGRSKIISSVFGGAAFTKNTELSKKIKEIQLKWRYPFFYWIIQQLFHPVFMAIIKPLYNFLYIGKILLVIGKKIGFISMMVYPVEKLGGHPPFGPARMPNALACLAVNQIKKLEKFNSHRREITEFYQRELLFLREQGDIKIHPSPPLEKEGVKFVFLIYPILVKDFETRQKCISAARKQGIYLEVWPAYDKKVIGPDNIDQKKLLYEAGVCPNAEKAAQASINLPTGPNITLDDAKRVVIFLQKFFGK